jgi:hypothetical protein
VVEVALRTPVMAMATVAVAEVEREAWVQWLILRVVVTLVASLIFKGLP